MSKNVATSKEKKKTSSLLINVENIVVISTKKPSLLINFMFINVVNTSVALDQIPAFFLQIASSVIIPYLQVFIEFCFTEGVFPKNCTIARIVPFFKKGKRDKPTIYYPISIFTCFSKIFEKLLYKRINNFLNKHKVIINSHYGFQSLN